MLTDMSFVQVPIDGMYLKAALKCNKEYANKINT